MRVDMTFDQQKVEQQGYTLAAVRQTVQKNFAAHGLHCVQNGPVLSCADCGSADDFADLWAVIMALLRTEWLTTAHRRICWPRRESSRDGR